MAKTAPTVTNSPATAAPDVVSQAFRAAHSGHPLTHIGSFSDRVPGNPTYDVFYCPIEHVLTIT